MPLPIYIVNAFASGSFTGNPAAVVITDRPLAESLMQHIAAQNNLSETAFVTNADHPPLPLRWFTPTVEIDLCGHATLAAAHVLFSHGYQSGDIIKFSTLSGELAVRKVDSALQLDFPARSAKPVEKPALDEIATTLACPSEAIDTCLKGKSLVVVLRDEQLVRDLKPDFQRIRALDEFAVMVTAASREVDFVVRFFAPNAGIDEDPVTGSAYTTLAPYWAERLGRKHLEARQLSARGGELVCDLAGDRVLIAGHVQSYLDGHITL